MPTMKSLNKGLRAKVAEQHRQLVEFEQLVEKQRRELQTFDRWRNEMKSQVTPVEAPPPADDVFAKVGALNHAIEVAWRNNYHPVIACAPAGIDGTDAVPPSVEVQLAKGGMYPTSRKLRSLSGPF